MKLVLAIVRRENFPAVKKALFDKEIHKMTTFDVLGCGQQKGFSETYRGVITEVNLLPKQALMIAVNEDFVKPTIEAIIGAARSGNIGDGKIFVLDLSECTRIRTGETGETAIG